MIKDISYIFNQINFILSNQFNYEVNHDQIACQNGVTIKTVSETKHYKNLSAQISLCMQRSL